MNGKSWDELSEQEHQDFPGDYEAQTGQGAITLHSEEHFGTTDKGIAFLRRFLERQLRVVEEGGDPAGVEFSEANGYTVFEAGNFLEPPEWQPAQTP